MENYSFLKVVLEIFTTQIRKSWVSKVEFAHFIYRSSPWMCSDCETEALQLQQDVSCISQGLLKKKPFLVDLAAL